VNLSDLAERVRLADGLDAFNERARIAFADEAAARVELAVTDGTIPIAAAFAVGDSPVELAVDPNHRRRGHATALLQRLLAAGEERFWAHGNLPAAQALAEAHGLTAARVLLRLTRSGPPPPASVPADVRIRPYEPADVPQILQVNTQAFAAHPEQGTMDRAAFERLAREQWFEPAGLFVAEQAGIVVGFHWTKRIDASGEIYVLAVEPHSRAAGVGRALATHGLTHLTDHGVTYVDLYVDADNDVAVGLYESLGFTEVARDVLYTA
jgi:mycothiol synthase